MVKSRSRDVMESRKRHPDKVRLELIVHTDVKAEFERFCGGNRLTRSELFTKMVQASLPDKEQSTDTTTLCSHEHLDKLKWLAGCYAVTPGAMLERLIDAGTKEQQAIEKRKRIHEAHDSKPNPEMARFLYELFGGDRRVAYREYKEFLERLQPGWVYDSTRKGTDPLAKRFSAVYNALQRLEDKAKKQAGTPEEIPAC